MRRWLVTLALCWMALCSSGCTGGRDVLTIGSKTFAEQAVLAQLARQLLQSQGQMAVQVTECGDTYQCQQALDAGQIDLMVEYSGTAALLLGIDPQSADMAAELEAAYGGRGLTWRPALGFDNSYQVAMASGPAHRLGVTTIAELSQLAGGIRLACPKSYLRRPRDGLAALLERHGLRLRGEARTLDDPAERIDAVLAGRVDAALVYGTDGALRNGGVELLDDSLDFFPRYQAAWLVRQDALQRFGGLAESLQRLEGQLDTELMQELNYAVQIEGWKPAEVARRFLVQRGWLVAGGSGPTSRLELVLAVAKGDELGEQQMRATRALRQVFPDRPVKIRTAAEPAELVGKAAAKLALVGSERFFSLHQGSFHRSTALEAVAVVGSRTVHLLRAGPSGAAPAGDGLAGRVGVAPPDSGAGRIGLALLRATGGSAALVAPAGELIAELEQGALDGALLVDELGSPMVTQALERQRVHLVSLPDRARTAAPYLRPSRVPAHTYAGQAAPVETVTSQVVLAGPSRRPLRAMLRPGPGAALLMEAAPLPIEEVRLLAEATGVPEWPDPVLPVAWTSTGAEAGRSSSSAVLNTLLNVLVLAFLAWLVTLVVRRDP